jgi:hypothetical protein
MTLVAGEIFFGMPWLPDLRRDHTAWRRRACAPAALPKNQLYVNPAFALAWDQGGLVILRRGLAGSGSH